MLQEHTLFNRKYLYRLIAALTLTAIVFTLYPASAQQFWQAGPSIYAPKQESTINSKVTFIWSPIYLVAGYRLDISTPDDTNFRNALHKITIKSGTATATSLTLDNGTYIARISGLNTNMMQRTAWSKTTTFTADETTPPVPKIPPGKKTTTPKEPTSNTPTLDPIPDTDQPDKEQTNPTTQGETTPVIQGSSAFTTPVAGLAINNRTTDWVDRLVKYAEKDGTSDWGMSFGFNTKTTNYGVPRYDAKDATGTYKVRTKSGWNGSTNIKPDEKIPFNPSWRPATGTDGFIQIYDSATGRLYQLWALSFWNYDSQHTYQCMLSPGFNASNTLCAASAHVITDYNGTIVDTRTYAGNFDKGSGGGWYYQPLTPEEVRAGKVTHALHIGTYNTSNEAYMCNAQQRLDPHALGNTCNDAIAPAGQYEGSATKIIGRMPITHTVPQGMRFSLKMTDAQIENFLNTKGYTGTKRSSVKTIIVGLRDYGWFVGSTTNKGALFTVSGAENTKHKQEWNDLGIGVDGHDSDILYGLFSTSNIVAYEPPNQLCTDGTRSKFWCESNDTRYQ